MWASLFFIVFAQILVVFRVFITISGDCGVKESPVILHPKKEMKILSIINISKMKKIFGIMMMLSLVFTTFSCSSDNDKKETPVWETIVGEYTGWTEGACNYFSQATDNETVTLSKATDGTLTVTVTSNTWGTSTFSNVTAFADGNYITLSGSGSAAMGMGSTTSNYDATLTGSISKDKSSANIVLVIPAVMGGTTVVFENGSAPVAKLLAGSYSGWSEGNCAYFKNYGQENSSVKLTANDDGTVNVAFESTTWGNTTIENVKATKTADGYSLEGSGKFSMGMGGSTPKEYDCNVTGTISSDKETYAIDFVLPSVMGGLSINFQNGSVDK